MFTVVLYVAIRSFSTVALIETTSAPVMPRSVFAASCTALSAALAKLSGDCPMIVTTLTTSAMSAPLLVWRADDKRRGSGASRLTRANRRGFIGDDRCKRGLA